MGNEGVGRAMSKAGSRVMAVVMRVTLKGTFVLIYLRPSATRGKRSQAVKAHYKCYVRSCRTYGICKENQALRLKTGTDRMGFTCPHG